MRTKKKSVLTNGQKLQGWRLQNKMTQTVLGDILGKNFRTISNYEKGRRPIPEDVISRLNKEYNLKLESSKTKKVTKKQSFAGRISSIRQSMKLTQVAFAKKFYFVPSHLWNIEKGNSDRVSMKSLKALYKAGIDLNSLVS